MSFARGFMRWLAPIGGASQDPRVVRDPPTASRFRVEPLEPRLLLSGDPLDVLKGSLELQLLQEPAVAISDTASAPSPSIDWGGGVMTKGDDPHDVLPAEQPTAPLPIAPATPQPTMPVEAAPVQNTDARTSTPTSSASTLTVDTAHGFVSSTNPATSQMSDTHDARAPPAIDGSSIPARRATTNSSRLTPRRSSPHSPAVPRAAEWTSSRWSSTRSGMCLASTMTTRSLPWPTCWHPGGASFCRRVQSRTALPS